MPFQSEAQRRFLWKYHPDVAKKWAKEHPESNKDLPYHKRKKSRRDHLQPDKNGFY